MPKYTFHNTQTKENVELTCSYDEMKTFISENPHMEQIFQINVVDPVGIGVKKPPADFQKHILSKMKDIPGAQKSQIEKRWAIPKEI